MEEEEEEEANAAKDARATHAIVAAPSSNGTTRRLEARGAKLRNAKKNVFHYPAPRTWTATRTFDNHGDRVAFCVHHRTRALARDADAREKDRQGASSLARLPSARTVVASRRPIHPSIRSSSLTPPPPPTRPAHTAGWRRSRGEGRQAVSVRHRHGQGREDGRVQRGATRPPSSPRDHPIRRGYPSLLTTSLFIS